MKSAYEIITKVLEEELDFIAEGKRNVVAERIVEELHIDRMNILSLDELSESSTYKPSVSE